MSILFIVNNIHILIDLFSPACPLVAEPLVKAAVALLLQYRFERPIVLAMKLLGKLDRLNSVAFPAKALHYEQRRDAFCSVLTDNYPYSADLFSSLADEVEKAPVRESCLHFSSFSAAGLVP